MSQENTRTSESFERPDKLIGPTTKQRLVKGLQAVATASLMLYVVLPLSWSVLSSVRPVGDIYQRVPSFIPSALTLEHFQRLLFETQFPRYMFNSVVVAIGAVVLTTILSLLGGYGLARTDFRGRRLVARGILFTYMFPAILLSIPLYVIFFRLNALNSYPTLIIAHTAICLPFCTWLMWQYFQSVPLDYEESAWLCGASRLRAIKDVMLPLARPVIVAVAIFTFAVSWNDYTLAVVIMTDDAMATHPVGVNQFIEQTSVDWGMVQAAGVAVMLPAFLIVLFLQKQLLTGFSVGGLE